MCICRTRMRRHSKPRHDAKFEHWKHQRCILQCIKYAATKLVTDYDYVLNTDDCSASVSCWLHYVIVSNDVNCINDPHANSNSSARPLRGWCLVHRAHCTLHRHSSHWRVSSTGTRVHSCRERVLPLLPHVHHAKK